MSKHEQEQQGKWIIRDIDSDRTWPKDAKEEVESALEVFGDELTLEVEPPEGIERADIEDGKLVVQGGESAERSENSQDSTENKTPHEAKAVEPVQEEPEQRPTQRDTVDLPEQHGLENIPKISPIEEKTRSVIKSLDHADMNRLVWDPDADPQDVPYNPKYLPYDRPEPSAEAFDMFSTIIEGVQDVRYSVVDVEFEETDDTLACSVIVEKQTPDGTKKLPGFKTRVRGNGPGLDHWRERLYSKARRNALKQDIPPTWVSALMEQYEVIETHD